MKLLRRDLLAAAGLAAGAGLGALFRASGAKASGPRLLRPPGALPESDFLAACIRCGQCVQACPHGTLRMARPCEGVATGSPYLVAREVPCQLCSVREQLECIAACPSGALQPVADVRRIRMGVAVIDERLCLAYNQVMCRACWHACPFPYEALRYDARLRPVVDAAHCIGCGLCDHACPTEPSSIAVPGGEQSGNAPERGAP